jgi:hypothetical protein
LVALAADRSPIPTRGARRARPARTISGRDRDDDVPTSTTKPTWRVARSHADLCALAEQFLSGRLRSFPGWGAPDTDPETDALQAALVAACRAGFLPLASQQGGPRRRAFVLGFAAPRLARLIAREAARRKLSCIVHAGTIRRSAARARREDKALEVGWEGGRAVLVVGADARAEELRLFARVGAGARRELARQAYVVLVDPRRAPSRRLWRMLEELSP